MVVRVPILVKTTTTTTLLLVAFKGFLIVFLMSTFYAESVRQSFCYIIWKIGTQLRGLYKILQNAFLTNQKKNTLNMSFILNETKLFELNPEEISY